MSHLRVACALRVLEEREVHDLCFWGSSCWRFGWGWRSCWEGELGVRLHDLDIADGDQSAAILDIDQPVGDHAGSGIVQPHRALRGDGVGIIVVNQFIGLQQQLSGRLRGSRL